MVLEKCGIISIEYAGNLLIEWREKTISLQCTLN